MFAGEGAPERTNRRFHYLAAGHEATRLSTAFDSTTLYGEDPDTRPDIFGRTGNSGVSIATLDDMKKLYSGFDLCKPVDLGVDDHQWTGADDPRDVHEHGDRSARRASSCASVAAGRGRSRAGARVRRWRRARATAASCRPGTTAAASGCWAPSGRELVELGVLEATTSTQALRAEALVARARHRAGGHPQGRPGAEHLHLLDRVRAAHDGRRAGSSSATTTCAISIRCRSPAITSPKPARTRSRSSRSRWPMASRSSSTTWRAA